MKNNSLIKVGICVAYDWELLKVSLPKIYPSADIICLAVDKNRRAWSGQRYDFDDGSFFAFVAQIDVDKKVTVYEDDFFLPELDKRQNCNRHRTLIAEKLGTGGWHIQVDADEYFLDFPGFCAYLKRFDPSPKPTDKAINICCAFIPLIKKVDGGYLFVHFGDSRPELIPMATNRPHYQRARQNGHFNHIAPFFVVHETWARSDDELWFKINNWGHASEELNEQKRRESYFQLWKALDSNNYQYVFNFHPASRKTWPSLRFSLGTDVNSFIENLATLPFPLTAWRRRVANSRNMARLRGLLEKIVK